MQSDDHPSLSVLLVGPKEGLGELQRKLALPQLEVSFPTLCSLLPGGIDTP